MDPSLVSRDPEIMSGALCFTGTRVPVKSLFEYLEGSSSLEEFLEDFPSISRQRAVDVLEAARQQLAAECACCLTSRFRAGCAVRSPHTRFVLSEKWAGPEPRMDSSSRSLQRTSTPS
jgi:uncharacterized protein (DUF433 family)